MSSAIAGGRRTLVCAFPIVCVLVLVVPVAEDPQPEFGPRLRDAQRILESLRVELSIDPAVHITAVVYHPFVFSVEPIDGRRREFRLSMEIGFLVLLSENELRAALAHELGHVWIFTHFPYLQTERLANEVGQRAVMRRELERLYRKLWSYEGTDGVAMEMLLGPERK